MLYRSDSVVCHQHYTYVLHVWSWMFIFIIFKFGNWSVSKLFAKKNVAQSLREWRVMRKILKNYTLPEYMWYSHLILTFSRTTGWVTRFVSVTAGFWCTLYIITFYRRALSSSSIDGVCAVINHACSVLDEKFIELLRGRLKLGYPSGALSQAYNIVSSSIQQGKLQSQDVDKSRQQFLVSITILYAKGIHQH